MIPWLDLLEPTRDPAADKAAARAQQAYDLMRRLPLLQIATLGVASISLAIFWPTWPAAGLLVWYAPNLVLVLLGLRHWRRYRRRPPPERVSEHWPVRMLWLAALASLPWVAALVFFFDPADPSRQIFLVMVMAGLSAGMMAACSHIPGVALGFILPIAGAVAGRLALTGTAINLSIAAMCVVYLLFMCAFARHSYAAFVGGVRSARQVTRLMDELRHSQSSLLDAIERIPEAVALFDGEERLALVNQKFRDDVLGGGIGELGSSVTRMLEHIAASGVVPASASGGPGWVQAMLTLARTPGAHCELRTIDGRALRLVCHRVQGDRLLLLVSDITELNARAVAIRETEQRFRDFAEAATDWLWELDENFRFTFMSAGARAYDMDLLDRAPGQGWEMVGLEPEDPAAWQAGMADIAARRPIHDFRVRRRGAAGEVQHLVLNAKPLFDAAGTFKGYRGTSNDISGRVLAAAELDRKGQVLQVTLDNINHGVLVLDRELKLVDFNRRILQLLHLPAERLRIGMSFAEVFAAFVSVDGMPEEVMRRELQRRLDFMAGRDPFVVERTTAAGTVFEVRGNPLPNGGWVVTQTDVSERKAVESTLLVAKTQAEVANRAKSEFLANMSHELRTPLNAILGFSELMLGRVLGPLGHDKYEEYIRHIHESGGHLLGVINDILDLSKIEAGKRELAEDVVDAAALLHAAVRFVDARAATAGLAVVEEIADALPALKADERAVKQILINLLSNAVKFTANGGRVTASARLGADGGLIFTVADTGIGMAPEHIAKALEPFGQVDSALGRKFEGTGLGLPLVKSLVELHGGRLVLESEPGKGTTAAVHFPPARTLRNEARAAG